MPGKGAHPKPPERRARRNAPIIPTTVIETEPTVPMTLPHDLLSPGEVWQQATLRWWRRWCESPLVQALPEVDWSELEILALLHHRFFDGEYQYASELRLRIAKFGATPEDRARLRIQIVAADTAEGKRPGDPTGESREKFGDLRVLPAAGE